MKFIIDLPDEIAEASVRYWKETTDMTLAPYIEPGHKAIEDEVWELAERIADMSYDDFIDCFEGETEEYVYGLPYREVKAKYEIWKRDKEEIHVGDEVTAKTDTDKDMPKGIVTYNNPEQSQFLVIKSDGTFSWWHKGGLRKTGRHFDEVEKLLERMREQE